MTGPDHADSQRAELMVLLQRTWLEMGGRGTAEDLATHVLTLMGGHLRNYLTDQGLRRMAGDFFRRQDGDGLPAAPEVDGHGTHVQGELLSVEEYRYVVGQHLKGARALTKQARSWARRCFEVHAVTIDVDSILRDLDEAAS